MDAQTERALLAEYPFHIVVLVKAAEQALEQGRATIVDGMLVFNSPEGQPKTKNRQLSLRPTADSPVGLLRFD